MATGMSRASPTRPTTRPTSTPCTSASVVPMKAKRYPMVATVKPKRRSLKSAKVTSNAENAAVTMK